MSLTERRVQLYLPDTQYRSVRHLAKARHASFAQVVREAIEGLIRTSRGRWQDDPISKHIGLFKGKEKDLSTHHDRYLYEA